MMDLNYNSMDVNSIPKTSPNGDDTLHESRVFLKQTINTMYNTYLNQNNSLEGQADFIAPHYTNEEPLQNVFLQTELNKTITGTVTDAGPEAKNSTENITGQLANNTSTSTVSENKEKEINEPVYTVSLKEMMERVKSEPKMKMIYSGIRENSVGFIYGPPKSAKTIWCENLGLCIASGGSTFLGIEIEIENRKVLFISLEEFYSGRTERNIKQVGKLLAEKGEEWLENFTVVTEHMPRYLNTQEGWEVLEKIIEENQPGIVFIDSLSRIYEGSIEDSKVAKDVMRLLRELANKTKTTLVVIHHTHKIYNSPITLNTIAGSRVLGQDADFMIGLNKTLDGKRYIKEVAFRYIPENNETVKVFNIEEDCWLNIVGEEDEAKLLGAFDGRVSELNKDKIFEFIAEQCDTPDKVITTHELEVAFVSTGQISKQTLHKQLNKLIQDKKIRKPDKGEYQLAA